MLTALCLAAALGAPPLTVSGEGVLLRDGQPYRALGVNFFDAFARVLRSGDVTATDAGFAELAGLGIPFARFMGCGFWPSDTKLYREDRAEYFRRFDLVVKSAEAHGIGLIPSLCWNFATVPDLAGEPMDQWGHRDSRTIATMREYVSAVVGRYKDSRAIWAWELGNEFNLGANLPNAAQHRPPVWPNLGTAKSRSERDQWTYEQLHVAYTEFGQAVRALDPDRPLSTGDSLLRPSAWHNWQERSWKQDTPEQAAELLKLNNPDPLNLVSVHAYGDCVEQLKQTAATCRALRKPLFVGEFGSPKTGAASEAEFARLLQAVQDVQAALAAVWVYNYNPQDKDWNVTTTNPRSYQLRALSDANRRLRG